MDQRLSLRVAFHALDKLTGPLKGMQGASERLSKSFGKARSELRGLQSQQVAITAFRKLKGEVEQTRTAMQEAAQKAQDLGRAIAQTDNPTKKMQREFNAARKASKDLERQFVEQNAELNRSRDKLREAGISTRDLGSHQRRLASEVEQANRRIEEQKRRLADLGAASKRAERATARAERIKGAGDKITGVGNTASVAVTAPIAGIAAFSIKKAMDFTEMSSAFDVTFGKNAVSMRKWAIETGKAMHRSRREMMEMSMSYQDILKKQMDPTKAMEMSKRLTVLTQDLASFKNLSNQDAKDKIFSGLIGESEPLRAVGVLLSDAMVKQQALKMGFKSIGKGDFAEGDKVQARAALIESQLIDAKGDVLRTSDSPANKVRAMSTAWDDASISIGQFLLALTPLIDKMTALLDAFNGLSPNLQSLIVWGGIAAGAFGPVVSIIGGMVTTFGALSAIAAALGIGLAPLIGIVAVVAAVVAGAAYLIYQNWDWLVQKLQPLFDEVKKVWNDLVRAFNDSGLGDWLQKLGDIAGKALNGTFRASVEMIIGWATGAFKVLGGAIKVIIGLLSLDFGKAWEGLKQMGQGAIDSLTAMFNGLKSTFMTIGTAIIDGLSEGFTRGWNFLMKRWEKLISLLPATVRSLLNINSPSRVFMALGGSVTEGLGMGIERGARQPIAQMRRVAAAVTGAGAMALAAPASAGVVRNPMTGAMARAAPGRPAAGPALTIGSIVINQQPGEDGEALADRVIRRLKSEQARARRSSYQDDF